VPTLLSPRQSCKRLPGTASGPLAFAHRPFRFRFCHLRPQIRSKKKILSRLVLRGYGRLHTGKEVVRKIDSFVDM
jgi:hypothetical protein